MDQSRFERWANAVNKLERDGIWDEMWRIHNGVEMDGHEGPIFLPWHRKFLLDVETLIQDAARKLGDPNPCEVTHPFWNWAADYNVDPLKSGNEPSDFVSTKAKTIKAGTMKHVFSRLRFGTEKDLKADWTPFRVDDGLFNWNKFNREIPPRNIWPGGPPPQQVRLAPGSYSDLQTEIENATTLNYARWSQKIEQDFHNPVHCTIGGKMCSHGSPADPIFFAHHSFLDKNWYVWQRLKGDATGGGDSGAIKHNICPCQGGCVASRYTNSASLDGIKVDYESRAEMLAKQGRAPLLVEVTNNETGEETLEEVVDDSDEATDEDYQATKMSALVDCCTGLLGRNQRRIAKAVILNDKNEDTCNVNFGGFVERSDKEWCKKVMRKPAGLCDAEVEATMQQEASDQAKQRHCLLANPTAAERNTCSVITSGPSDVEGCANLLTTCRELDPNGETCNFD